MSRILIKASKGKILTDGETYGKEIFLAEGVDASTFHEIPEEEYQKILEEQDAEITLIEHGGL